jgi:hypothetical protein
VGDYRLALLAAAFLFVPAAAVALALPEPPDGHPAPAADHARREL